MNYSNSTPSVEAKPNEDSIVIPKTEIVKAKPPSSPPPDIYIVKEGDTLESIAQKYGIGIKRIRVFNNMNSYNNTIFPGQKLILTEKSWLAETTGTEKEAERIAVENEKWRLWECSRCGSCTLCLNDINMLDHHAYMDSIMSLTFPEIGLERAGFDGAIIHTTESNETIQAIARAYDVYAYEIKRWNKGYSGYEDSNPNYPYLDSGLHFVIYPRLSIHKIISEEREEEVSTEPDRKTKVANNSDYCNQRADHNSFIPFDKPPEIDYNRSDLTPSRNSINENNYNVYLELTQLHKGIFKRHQKIKKMILKVFINKDGKVIKSVVSPVNGVPPSKSVTAILVVSEEVTVRLSPPTAALVTTTTGVPEAGLAAEKSA